MSFFYLNLCYSYFFSDYQTFHCSFISGFWHEQSRYDRDNYVKINKQNIKEGKSSNFDKRKKIDSADFEQDLIDRTPYDYCSLMHYPAYAFTKVSLHH